MTQPCPCYAVEWFLRGHTRPARTVPQIQAHFHSRPARASCLKPAVVKRRHAACASARPVDAGTNSRGPLSLSAASTPSNGLHFPLFFWLLLLVKASVRTYSLAVKSISRPLCHRRSLLIRAITHTLSLLIPLHSFSGNIISTIPSTLILSSKQPR